MALALSEETRERLAKVVDVSRNIFHYGWIPFILYVGWSTSFPRPSIIKLFSPLSN
ncbi:TOM7 family-domain-containing protein [Dipodascopsis tothii]|uniref:TOM7 family-domain-containing protein n=1 Tax=Dipodascopsis tothii TaxID=44089 RepID=UPI0034D02217